MWIKNIKRICAQNRDQLWGPHFTLHKKGLNKVYKTCVGMSGDVQPRKRNKDKKKKRGKFYITSANFTSNFSSAEIIEKVVFQIYEAFFLSSFHSSSL